MPQFRGATLGLGLLVLLTGPALAQAQSGVREILPGTVVPLHYDLQLSPDAAHLSFKGKVAITVQVNAGGAWYTDTANTIEDPTALVSPTIVQVDEIAIAGVTGTVPGPFGFDTAANTALIQANLSADGMSASPPWSIAGSSVTFVGP